MGGGCLFCIENYLLWVGGSAEGGSVGELSWFGISVSDRGRTGRKGKGKTIDVTEADMGGRCETPADGLGAARKTVSVMRQLSWWKIPSPPPTLHVWGRVFQM